MGESLEMESMGGFSGVMLSDHWMRDELVGVLTDSFR